MVDLSNVKARAARIPREALSRERAKARIEWLCASCLRYVVDCVYWVLALPVLIGNLAEHIWKIVGTLSTELKGHADEAHFFAYELANRGIRHQVSDSLASVGPDSPPAPVIELARIASDSFNQEVAFEWIATSGRLPLLNWKPSELGGLLLALFPHNEDPSRYKPYDFLPIFIEVVGTDRSKAALESIIEKYRGPLSISRGGLGVLTWLEYHRYVELDPPTVFRPENRPTRIPMFKLAWGVRGVTQRDA